MLLLRLSNLLLGLGASLGHADRSLWCIVPPHPPPPLSISFPRCALKRSMKFFLSSLTPLRACSNLLRFTFIRAKFSPAIASSLIRLTRSICLTSILISYLLALTPNHYPQPGGHCCTTPCDSGATTSSWLWVVMRCASKEIDYRNGDQNSVFARPLVRRSPRALCDLV